MKNEMKNNKIKTQNSSKRDNPTLSLCFHPATVRFAFKKFYKNRVSIKGIYKG